VIGNALKVMRIAAGVQKTTWWMTGKIQLQNRSVAEAAKQERAC
jgi:hypothetical protein